jgi:Flp pilus assembly pilin Flp
MDALMFAYCYIKNLFKSEEGQDLIEYALIIAVFVIVAVIGLSALGPQVQKLWEAIGAQLGVQAGGG